MTLSINGKTYEAGEFTAYVEKLEKENTEMKADNDARKFAMAMSEKVEKQLQKENAELKEKYDTCLRENTGLKIHSAYVEKKLAKAKEIIRNALTHGNYSLDWKVKAEQFLKEVEK